MVINGIIDLDNGELLEATGKHRISALDIQGSETAELKLTFYKNGSAVTDNSVVSGAVIDFGVKADADYTGTSYLIYHDTFSASTDGLTYSGTPTWATAEVETALGNESSVKLHGQVKVVISGVTYYSQVFEVEIHNNVIQAAGTTNSVIYPRLIQSTSDPTVNDDSLDGYGVSSLWLNTSSNAVHVLMDNTAGAAVWAGFLGLTNGQLANNLVFNDNLKAVFGTSSDGLEIYHDESNSIIKDSGTGVLNIQGSTQVNIGGVNGQNGIQYIESGTVKLRHANSTKLNTESFGCTVTGKLVVSGDLDVDGTTTTFNSTVVTVDDPVFGIGGDTAPGSQDNKDRGVSFRYHDGASAKVGFFGWDNSENAFTFLTDTNDDSTEVFSGTLGNLKTKDITLSGGTLQLDSAYAIQWGNGNNRIFGSSGNNYIRFDTNGTEAARFDASGHFLIPADNKIKFGDNQEYRIDYDSSGYAYHQNGSGSTYFVNSANNKDFIFQTTTGDTTSEVLRLDGSASTIKVPDDVYLQIGSSNDLQIYHTTSSNHSWIYNSTGHLQVTNAAINSDIVLRCKDATTVNELMRLDGSTSSINVPDEIEMFFGSSSDFSIKHGPNNTHHKNFTGDFYISNDAANNDLIFRASDGTLNELLRLTGSTGNVGINQPSPSASAKLDVNGNIHTSTGSGGVLKLYDDTEGRNNRFEAGADADGAFIKSAYTSGGTSDLRFIRGSTEKMRLNNSGLGIGTTNPSRTLSVNSGLANIAASFESTDSGSYLSFLDNSTSNDSSVRLGAVGNDFQFFTNGQERLRVLSTGEIGIGTISPSGNLTIEDSSNVITDINTTTANANTTVRFRESGSNKATIGYDGTNNGLILTTGGFTAGNGIFINDSQNVGIGTAAPSVSLDISSSDAAPVKIYRDGVNASLHVKNNADDVFFGVNTNGNAAIGHDLNQASAPFQISSAGNVGIGDSSLDKTFTVNGNSKFYNTSSSKYIEIYGGNSANFIDSFSNDLFLRYGGDSSKAIVLNSSGNVGIGVTNPSAFLHVSKDNNNSGNQFCVADTEGATAAIRTYATSEPQGLIINHYYAEGGSGNEYARYADFVSNVGSGAATKMRFITKNAANNYFTTIIDNEGRMGIGGDPSENADLTLGGGELCMAETTTPTADANFGKIYCKSDNKLYFQDGAGTEHEIAFV